MDTAWISMIVAVGLILGFYYTRRQQSFKKYHGHKSSSSVKVKTPRKKNNRSKLRDCAYSRESSISVLSQKLEHKKKKESSRTKKVKTASLLLHPHSLEQAKLQYLANACSFQGLYELLYQASQGSMQKSSQKDLLKAWENKINTTHSQHLEMVWKSSVYSPISVKNADFENVFRVWLKYLKGWGLQRSVEAGEIYWSLNGNILEQCIQDSKKSIN
ncbi:hypothetical protein [Desulfitobacterium metallireducens]|uniref:Uncharacterized protein n=1 Tax=Desulfitobacterium metallireducens DSM 15288 TaxID=871968 RepID=W0ECD4_9FIRM|nr:hypothetical protein [Desulfitobacterium metallireducens]AHF08545.1 hypothetical protein DESME_08430 [Desulfitobacterium metallireducens DSM 15288]